jgi:O-antigen ligase
LPKTASPSIAARLLSPTVLLLVLLGIVALGGGSARTDVSSLVYLRPLSVLLAALAIAGFPAAKFATYKSWIVLLFATLALLLIHMVPLPPALWQSLPGRGLLAEIDRAAGLGDIWRPLSFDPIMTRNAMWSMAVPFAALFLAMRLDDRGIDRSLIAVLAVGLVSGLLGVMQFASGSNSPIYLYNITNNGFAVGFFANRNHQGVFLASLFPLLAAYAVLGRKDGKDRNVRVAGTAGVAAMFIPMILATSSRAGLTAAVIGIAGAIAIAWPQLRKPTTARTGARRSKLWLYALAGGIFVALSLALVGLTQGNSFTRLVEGDGEDPELRWQFWKTSVDAAEVFFPLGAGLGSFVKVFQIFEPDQLLDFSYVNHAHNDYVELLLDGGIPALLLALAALVLVGRDGWRVWWAKTNHPRVLLARAAFVGLLIFAIASAVDYPLRTPLLAAIACIFVVWLRRGALSVGRPISA